MPNAQLQKGFASDALGDAVSVPNAGPARTSMGGVAAIDHKSLTDSERCEVGAKKQDHTSHLFRLRDAANRRVSQKSAANIRVIEPWFCHRRFHQSRSERIDPNSLICVFKCGGFR